MKNKAKKNDKTMTNGSMNGNGSGNFFSSGIRQKVDQLMDTLWAGGVNNPMDSIEQLSYLIFLRLLSERDEEAALLEPGYRRIFSGTWAGSVRQGGVNTGRELRFGEGV